MPGIVSIGDISARPGEKRSGRLPVADRSASNYSLPLTIINGVRDGPTVTIIAGQHGTQYVGIAAALEIIRKIDPRDLSGVLQVVPVVNVLGFELRERLAFPMDDDFNGKRDLNTLWPGDPRGSLAQKTVHALFNEVVKKGQYLVEMRGGDIYEYLIPGIAMVANVGNPEVDGKTMGVAEAAGFEYIVVMSPPPGQGRGRSHIEGPLAGIPTAVLEIGDQGRLDLKLLEKAVASLMNVLRSLKMLEGAAQPNNGFKMIAGLQQVRARTGGVYIQKIPIGTEVKEGQVIGEVLAMDGRSESVVAPINGLLLSAFYNPAVNSGEILAEVATLRSGGKPQSP